MTGLSAVSRKLLLLGAWSAAIAIAPTLPAKSIIALPLVLAASCWWILQGSSRWLMIFFFLALLTPPLPFAFGDAGLNLAPFAVALGIVASAIRMNRWVHNSGILRPLFGFFLAIVIISSAMAALYSGAAIGAGSLARAILFAIGVFVFLYAADGPRIDTRKVTRILFLIALGSALFACADYYFQFPAPAGFEQQFVWLDDGVFRRAQGLFYEASTLGNFCAFFLVMTLVACFEERGQRIIPRSLLIFGAFIFATALILSYSRASVLTILIAFISLIVIRRISLVRSVLLAVSAAGVALLAIWIALPTFFAGYWARIAGSFSNLTYAPNAVFSGRLSNWGLLANFLIDHPWHAILGVGYKSLPYSDFTGSPIIADNTWLSLLAETGIVGLFAFVALNAAILRSSWRAARADNFYGRWIFCFWTGEIVQMFSGDLITYWRVLPVYFWVLGTALRESRQS